MLSLCATLSIGAWVAGSVCADDAQPRFDFVAGQDAADEEPAADDAAAEEGGEGQEAAAKKKELSLTAEAAKDKAMAKMLRKLVKEKADADDYKGLQDELKRLLTEAFPASFGEDGKPDKTAVKGSLAKQAMAIYKCIDYAAGSKEGASDEVIKKEPDFLKWLVTDKKVPAKAFADGLTKHKVSDDEALSMMADLRNTFADLGAKKSATEIKNITNPTAGGVSRQLYPVGKKDMEKKVKELLATRPAHGADSTQQDAVNMVNVYRFLCNVETFMTFDSGYKRDAQDASDACKKAGTISHGLGHSTDKCNLHMGSQIIPAAASVIGYVEDAGDNNREKRGHRAWILFPQSRKTAFGVSGGFHAMRTSDLSGQPQKKARSYPGRGFFPANYLKGNGWSYYPAQGVSVPQNAKVEMWRMPRSLKAAPSAKELASAPKVNVQKVFVHPNNGGYPVANSIVFEPDYSQFTKKDGMNVGVYWVRITGTNFKDEYVVDLFL